jgi:uncharacterized membrane protein YeiH
MSNLTFNTFIYLLEMIGTIAFAISGVQVAAQRRMDLFGAIVLGCTTACGGGVIRDLLLGITPPGMFLDPSYILMAFLTSLVTFVIMYTIRHRDSGRRAKRHRKTGESAPHRSTEHLSCRCTEHSGRRCADTANGDIAGRYTHHADNALNAADAIGLASFVIIGYQGSFAAGYTNRFLAIFVAVITGIGGGIFRDIMAGQMPLIMRRRIYGVAAITGALVFDICWHTVLPNVTSSLIAMAVTVLIRFLATHYRWNLPSFG